MDVVINYRNFNPLPPHGGRRNTVFCFRDSFSFQSTPSAWRETCGVIRWGYRKNISIHSLRMEGDISDTIDWDGDETFQSTPSAWRETIRSPTTGGVSRRFQSTPSAWRETEFLGGRTAQETFQSTPSAWRETSPRKSSGILTIYFNPLPPHGGRHVLEDLEWLLEKISIHSLRMEGDRFKPFTLKTILYFNPLPPHGGRHALCFYCINRRTFQSTPSAWRETTVFRKSTEIA